MRLFLIVSLISTCTAPFSRPNRNRNRNRHEPQWPPLPELQLPYQGVYITLTGSVHACAFALGLFQSQNFELCSALRVLAGQDTPYTDVLARAYTSWGARLCNDPELPQNDDYSGCDAAFFCRITSNYIQCPQSFLQQYLNPVRFKMKCVGTGQQVYLKYDQPDTIAECMTPEQHAERVEKEKIAAEEAKSAAKLVGKVVLAEGKVFYAKPEPWVSKVSCQEFDFKGGTSKSEL